MEVLLFTRTPRRGCVARRTKSVVSVPAACLDSGNREESVTVCAPSRRDDRDGLFGRQEQVRRQERRRASSMLCSTGWGWVLFLVESSAGGGEGRREQRDVEGAGQSVLVASGSEALLSG